MIDALLGACIAGHVVVADTLILNGADVNTVDMNGVSPLMYAAAFDYVVMADMLLFYNANINAADYSGNTALHYSSFYENIEVSKQLVKRQANIDAADADGFTPLMIAAQNGYLELLALFLENGANINKTNIYNLDALSLAIIGRHEHIVKYLLDKGIQVDRRITDKLNQFDLAALYGNKQTLETLKHAGLKPLMKTWIDKLYINPAITFNTKDILMGVHTGILDSKTAIQLELGYKTRPWVRSVLYEVNENTYYQFWEKRSVAHIGIDKNFNLKDLPYYENLGLFTGINFGYTFGSFRGSNKKPDDVFILVPKAGMFYNFKSFNVRVNYEYMKFKNSSVSPHFVGISMGIMINLVKNRIRLKTEPVL
jgi:hypothetical protein